MDEEQIPEGDRVTCPDCHGDENMVDCTNCWGKGWVTPIKQDESRYDDALVKEFAAGIIEAAEFTYLVTGDEKFMVFSTRWMEKGIEHGLFNPDVVETLEGSIESAKVDLHKLSDNEFISDLVAAYKRVMEIPDLPISIRPGPGRCCPDMAVVDSVCKGCGKIH